MSNLEQFMIVILMCVTVFSAFVTGLGYGHMKGLKEARYYRR